MAYIKISFFMMTSEREKTLFYDNSKSASLFLGQLIAGEPHTG
jgi:hypothetical protein